jgi:hypothetical protein
MEHPGVNFGSYMRPGAWLAAADAGRTEMVVWS